jgi:hypothetical protein
MQLLMGFNLVEKLPDVLRSLGSREEEAKVM